MSIGRALRMIQRPAAGGPWSPLDLSGLYLWLRPEGLSSLSDGDPIDAWPDESGNGNDAAQANASNQPECRDNPALGCKIMYAASHYQNYLSFPRTTSIRYLAAVAQFLNANPFVLGDSIDYHWHSGMIYGYWWHTKYCSSYIRTSGVTLQNDVEVSATTPRSTDWMQYTVRTGGDVTGSRLFRDRDISTASVAKLAEVIVCTSVVSADDDLLVRSYLKDKYGL